MIPYFQFVSFQVGPLTIFVWGLFVALGLLAALLLGVAEARKRGLSADAFVSLATWTIIAAFITARLAHVFLYDPARYLATPLDILKIWQGGLSSFGGFAGGLLGMLLWARQRGLKLRPYLDLVAYVLPLGYGIGRLGCFLIHDHPGTLSHSLLAVNYPGGARLDHGLLLSLLGFAIFIAMTLGLRSGKLKSDQVLPFFLIVYGASRFILDFYRAWDLTGADARYLALTPAQWGSMIFILAGLIILKKYGAKK